MRALVKPPKPGTGTQKRSIEEEIAQALWRMIVWVARLVARHPWRTLWALATLGFWGSHQWVLVGLTLGLPIVAIVLWRSGAVSSLLVRFRFTRGLLDRQNARAAESWKAGRLKRYRRAFEEHAPYVLPQTEYGEIPQPVGRDAYGEHRFGWYVDLRLPRGLAPKALEDVRDPLAHALGVRRLDVTSTRPGQVRLLFFVSDPLAHDAPAGSGLPQLAPFEVGVLDTGDPMKWDPGLSPHMIVIGQTRSGKSAFLRTLLYSLPTDGSWEVGLCDFKRVEFGLYKPGGKIAAAATSHKEIADLADSWQADMMTRLDEMVRAGVSRAADLPHPVPHRLILIDEYMALVASAEDARRPRKPPKGQEEPEEGVATMVGRVRSALSQLSLLGGAANYHVILGLHQPTASLFGSAGKRSQYRAVVALRALDRDGCTMAFQGADVSEVQGRFDGKQGHGVCVNVGGDEAGIRPHAFRAHFIRDEAAARRLICGG